MLLGLDGLVEPLGVPAAQHQAAGVLVHDDDLPVLDHVVHVPLHDAVSLHGLVDVVGQGGVLHIRQVFQAELPLGLGDAPGGEGGGPGLLIHDIVGVDVLGLLRLLVHRGHHQPPQPPHEVVRPAVEVRGLVPLAGDDQGRTGLVDEDGVHLVHDGEGVAPLDHIGLVEGHVVPQIIEAHLIVGAVGDVRGVGSPALVAVQAVDDEPHAQPHETVDLAHPLAVALGQVVVHGDDVHALAGQCVQIGREHGHQGLALAGLHLSDAPLVEHHAADELHPEGPHAQHPLTGLPHGGKGLRQQALQILAAGVAGLELVGLGAQRLVAEGLVLRPQGLDPVHNRIDLFHFPLGICAEELIKKSHVS